jgi:hypothetical protein
MELFRECIRNLREGFADLIFQFLELCRPHLSNDNIPQQLDTFEKRIAARLALNLEATRKHAREIKLPSPPKITNLLQVIVDPVQRPARTTAYHIWMNVVSAGETKGSLFNSNDVAFDRVGLSKQFQQLFEKAFDSVTTFENFRIEAALPLELLLDGIEDWLAAGGSRPKPVGKIYPVALRSHERTYHSDFRGGKLRQEQKWKQLVTGLAPNHFIWLDSAPAIDLEGPAPWMDADLIVLGALDLGPLPPARTADVMDAVVMSGIPLAVWLRGHATGVPAVNSLTDLKNIFVDKTPDQWIAQGLAFRNQAAANRKPAGDGMFVLYDDPTQPLPPLFGRNEAPLTDP